MKQVFSSGKGEVEVFEVPIPARVHDSVLVRNAFSIISSGTEGVSVSKKRGILGVYEKARATKGVADKVWQLVQAHGYKKAYDRIREKLSDYSPMGYSTSGWVVEVDHDNLPFKIGDRVACMGAGIANHAEYVVVPKNLVVRLPDHVSLEEASCAALGCIATQGIRRLELTPGERVGVLGLGLIGQITVRILDALGFSVYGIDLDPGRAATAEEIPGVQAWALDSTDSRLKVMEFTQGLGLDGVVVTAATTDNAPINLAFDLSRKRGRVSLVGDVGLLLDREKMYAKELELRLSCSYGPGRYDPEYELRGNDYPFAYVRWTEARNLEFFLNLLASKKLDLIPLLSKRFPIDHATAAYGAIKQTQSDTYGVLFDYGPKPEGIPERTREKRHTIKRVVSARTVSRDRIRIGIIGVGGHTKEVHIPNLKKLHNTFVIRGTAGRAGSSAGVEAAKLGAAIATSDYRELLDDPETDAVLIATRHTSHARIVLDALDAGKHVFVEKPLALTVEDAQEIVNRVREKELVLRVGFNRRFSPFLNSMRKVIGTSGRRIVTMRVNIGVVAEDWSNTAQQGGRVLGEVVHFFDLCNWFMKSVPMSLSASFVGDPTKIDPSVAATIQYPDGSVGHVLYTSLGNKQMGKEYFEAFGNGRAARSDDYRNFSSYGASESVGWGQRGNKGHYEQLREFASALHGSSFPIEGADARAGLTATWLALATYTSAEKGRTVILDL
jgi:predicted dehydrogenase/threonine dehydrogenase-like Zn-dependent dehydrogenase